MSLISTRIPIAGCSAFLFFAALGARSPMQPTVTIAAGVRTWSDVWVDSARQEPLTKDPNDRRHLHVRIWIPEHTKKNARLPVIVFSPGAAMRADQYSVLLSDLARRGYVVVGMSHPFDSRGLVLLDSVVVPVAQPDSSSNAFEFARQIVATRVADARFALTRVRSLGRLRNGPLASIVDERRAAIIGHSRGGVAALETCREDDRFKVCVNLDGGVLGGPYYPDLPTGPRAPTLWLQALHPIPPDSQLSIWKMTRQQWDSFDIRADELLRRSRGGAWRATLPDTAHYQFVDPDARTFRSENDRERAKVSLRNAIRVSAAFLAMQLHGRSEDELLNAVRAANGKLRKL